MKLLKTPSSPWGSVLRLALVAIACWLTLQVSGVNTNLKIASLAAVIVVCGRKREPSRTIYRDQTLQWW